MSQHCRYYSPTAVAAAAAATAKSGVAASCAATASGAAATSTADRHWRSYLGGMLQPPLPALPPPAQQLALQDSASDGGTSYCTHTTSTAATCGGGGSGIARTSWTHWTPAGGCSYLGGASAVPPRDDCGGSSAARKAYSASDSVSASASGGEDDAEDCGYGSGRRVRGERTGRSPFARPLAWLWTLLSMLVFGTCAFALVQPHWIISGSSRPRGKTALGLINYCVMPQRQLHQRPVLQPSPPSLPSWPSPSSLLHQSQLQRHGSHLDDASSASGSSSSGGGGGGGGDGEEWCAYYGEQVSLSSVPSLSWRTALLTYVGGCVTLAFGSLQAAFCLCMGQPHRRRLSLAAGYFQLLAVILLITSLLIYPVGLDSPVVKAACDNSGIYYGGTCHVGWSYALAIAGAALSVFCPVLSHYVDYPPGGGGGSSSDDSDDGNDETAETVAPRHSGYNSTKRQ